MSKKIRVKPSKGQSTAGFFVGIVFCLIGLFVVIPTAGPFGIFWTMVAVIITITHGKNAFTEKGVATHEIVIEDDELNQSSESYAFGTDSQKRLYEIKNLYDNGFMTKEEYEDKRKKIINNI